MEGSTGAGHPAGSDDDAWLSGHGRTILGDVLGFRHYFIEHQLARVAPSLSPDAKMTQEAADFKEKFARLLAAVLATCRFTLSQESYTANAIRTLYNSDPRRFSQGLLASIKSTTADRFIDLLKHELARAGVEWKNARLNSTLLSPHSGTTEPMGLLQSILRGGAILGPEKATDIVHGRLHGDRLAYVRNYVLLGVEFPAGVPAQLKAWSVVQGRLSTTTVAL